MNKEKYAQLIASFLIALVITIPFYITSAYAGIDKITVKGSDGIEGTARSSDALDFSVEATSATTQITKDNIYLGSDLKFDKCTSGINKGAVCTLKYPAAGKQDFGNNPFQFVISMFKDASKAQLEDSKTGTVVVDNLPPVVKLSAPKEAYSGAENILLDYEAVDISCNSASCAGRCSGIKSIEFASSDGSFKQAIEPKTAECRIKDQLAIDPKKLDSGANVIIAKATDKFGQVSQESSFQFSLDSTAPRILTGTFVIISKGVSINTYAPSSVPVEVFINISANDLDAGSVTAELTALNPSAKFVRATCQRINSETNRCRWAIDLNPGIASSITGAPTAAPTQPSTTATIPSSSRAIIINAADVLGNKATATISKTLALDDKGPVLQSITTGASKDKLFVKPAGSLVEASFDEATGLIGSDVFLYVGSSRFAAENCRKDSAWTCRWRNINFPQGTTTLQIKSDTVDIFGNKASDSQPVEVIVDGISPVVTGISLTPVGTLSASANDLFKIEDKIAVEANITEENDITATADFSKFTGNAAKIPGTCKRLEGNKQQCIWLSDQITKGGTNNIKFNFTDPALNEVIVEKPLTALELDSGQTPDFWSNSVECSPKNIDRQLGTLFNQRTYCRIKLEPKAENIETLSISPITLSSCKSTQPIVQGIETFNNGRGSTEPFLKITFKKDPLEINEEKLTCTFSIISRSGNRVTKNSETETAEINIKFYNFPLGKFDEGIQKKIDDAKNDARESMKIVGQLNKIMFYARKICQIIGIIYTFVTIVSIITAIQKATADAAASSVIGAPAAPGLHVQATSTCVGQQNAEDAADKTYTGAGPGAKPGKTKSAKGGADKFCKFVNCQWAPGVMGQYQEWIGNQINKLPAGTILPGPGQGYDSQQPFLNKRGRGIAGYMDPTNNLGTALVFACVPGIISGLEKFRQIKCLYADCLENAVAKDGLPAKACEDLKNYAECKYLWGEIFALIPYTAVFDYFTNIIKDALSNPFSALGIGLSLTIGGACKKECYTGPPASKAVFVACEAVKLTSKVGEVLENVQGIYKEGFKIRQDYCSRLDLGEESKKEGSEESAPASSPAKK